jgi:hypothetical protein
VSLTISNEDLNLVSQLQNELVLAIIMQDDRVRFHVADSHRYPGHAEWLHRDGIQRNEVIGGFSVLVKAGRVHWLFALSHLNDPLAPALSDEQIAEVASLLPMEPGFQVYK